MPWNVTPFAQVPPGAALVYGRTDDGNVSWLSLAPVNEDAPALLHNGTIVTSAAVGDTLTCTMGNWLGTPTGYAYQWKSNGVNVGTNSNSYTVAAGDSGHTITCVVTATNAGGSTAAPPSAGVHIA